MKPSFEKGLLPAIVQDAATGRVLMVGFMNEEAYLQTASSGEVTFFSRSKNRLWRKGETSGNVLKVKDTFLDCDGDSILILATPNGPTCHNGDLSCFGPNTAPTGIVLKLEDLIAKREKTCDPSVSYTARLFKEGKGKISQKVGEEAIEFIIASLGEDKDEVCKEGADLLYHFLVLLKANGLGFADIEAVLEKRLNKG